MKIKYVGKLDPETNPLPTNKLKEGAIRFVSQRMKKRNIQTSIVTFIIMYYVCTRIFKCSLEMLMLWIYQIFLAILYSQIFY